MTSARTLVTGATGFLGRRLVAALEARGHAVVVTSRDAERARESLGGSVACFGWDYRSEPFPARALEGVESVYHLMGESIASFRWTPSKKEALRGSRIDSTHALAAALPDSVRDFLCASAIGIYPGDTHEPFDEDTPLPPPRAFLPRLCHDWEAAAAAAATPSRRVANLRIGLVLGESGMLAPLVPLYRLGLGGPVGDGRQRLPWVHVDDLIEMMLFVRSHRELEGPVNLVGPEPVALETFSRTLARIVHRPHLFRVPAALVRIALGEAATLLLASYDVRPAKLTKSGFAFRYPTHEAALESVVRELY